MQADEIRKTYSELRSEIDERLGDFMALRVRGDEREIFAELAFCLLTPQSRAKVCWAAVERMKWDALFHGSEKEITGALTGVRFKYTKAKRVIEVRRRFPEGKGLKALLDSFEGPFEAREWLVRNINGYGYKEASHFLRNTGYGLELAILDRHILRNLVSAGVLDEMPETLTRKRYLEIEEKMRRFSDETGVPMPALDLIFWYDGAGEIFK